MDGGGVAETGRLMYVIAGQPDRQVAAGVSHGQVTLFGDVGDGPPVAVFDPVGGGEAESAVVGPGDDHVSATGLVSVRQAHLAGGRVIAKAMITSLSVEFGDKLSSGSDHDRVEPRRLVGNPSAEGSLCGGGEVADMNAAVIKVEVECLWFAFSEGER